MSALTGVELRTVDEQSISDISLEKAREVKAKVVVENDKLTVEEFDETEQEFSAHCKEVFGTVGHHPFEFETDGLCEHHVGVLNAFAGKILHGTPLIADGREGILGVTISNAIHLSAWLGKPVEIPFDEDLHYEELKKRIATSKIKTGPSIVSDTSDSFGGTK